MRGRTLWGYCQVSGPPQIKRSLDTHTGQIAIERFLPGVAPHVCLECVPAGVWHALPRAADPFACVLLLPALNVVVMDMLDKPVHVPHVPGPAPFPRADCDLLLEVILVWSRVDGRARDIAVRVGGNVRHAFQRIPVCVWVVRGGGRGIRSSDGFDALGGRSVVQRLARLLRILILGGVH